MPTDTHSPALLVPNRWPEPIASSSGPMSTNRYSIASTRLSVAPSTTSTHQTSLTPSASSDHSFLRLGQDENETTEVPPRTPSPLFDQDGDDAFPPSISQPRLPSIHIHEGNDGGAGPLLVAPETKTTRDVRKQRSVERTRTWAEEVERRRRKAERAAQRKLQDRERKLHVQNSPYDDNFWSCSSEVFDSMLDELDPERVPRSIRKASTITERKSRRNRNGVSAVSWSDEDRSYPARKIESLRHGGPQSDISTRGHRASPVGDNGTVSLRSLNGSSKSNDTSSSAAMKPPIMSIDELVRRHSDALSRPETAAKAKARVEVARESPGPHAPNISEAQYVRGAGGPSRDRSSKISAAPSVPARRSSTPGANVAIISPRTSSLTISSQDDTCASTSSSDVVQKARIGQALLDRLDSYSVNSPRSRSSRASKAAVETQVYHQAATPVINSNLAHRGVPAIEDPDEIQALALYLRSPNLNRFLDLPRPFPERPLRVSYSEVGAPGGYPVLVFLGLGCVRFLIALFDEIATAFNLRLICIDRWGFGRTGQVPEESRSCTEWATVVLRVLDDLGIDKCQILAHSAGAPYAGALSQRLDGRLRGRLHFLAPWVNADIDGGYKWLKYIPNGLIKGAVAAEWRLQSYMLGKAPKVSYAPVESPARTPSPTLNRRSSLLFRRSSTLSLSPIQPAKTLGRSPRVNNLKSLAPLRSRSLQWEPSNLSCASNQTPSSTSAKQASPLTPTADEGKLLAGDFGLGEGFDSLGTSLALALPTYLPEKQPPLIQPKPSMTPALTQALMQASHAESEPGTTSDLLFIVLNRPSRAMDFSYSDLIHPAVVWYGCEDEKVGEKGMRWLERSLTAGCELRIKPGEGHNLMTSSKVMWEVFESLGREARAR